MRLYATFTVYGCPLIDSNLSEVFGVEPDRTVHKGDKLSGNRVVPQDGWFWSTSDKVMSDDIDLHLEKLFEVFFPHKETIASLVSDGVRVEIVLFEDTDSGNGSVYLSKDVIQKTAELSAAVYVDVYMGAE